MDVFEMKFSKVFPLLIAKAERKGRTIEEVYAITTWLMGYTHDQLEALLKSESSYGDFLDHAPWITMITTEGVAHGKYAGMIQSQVKLDDLFAI